MIKWKCLACGQIGRFKNVYEAVEFGEWTKIQIDQPTPRRFLYACGKPECKQELTNKFEEILQLSKHNKELKAEPPLIENILPRRTKSPKSLDDYSTEE